MFRVACFVALGLAVGCAQGHSRGGSERDAGPPPTDAGATDAGTDAGALDAGTDAGGFDAGGGAVDAGPGTDAGPACPSGQMFCDGACRDVSVDPRHCGGCGAACAGGEVCAAGTCSLSCSGGTTACGGSCVDLATDEAHCGDCTTTCSGAETCEGGTCTPPITGGCADGTVEVTWSSTVHGCRGPTSTWGHYATNVATYCASGWTMAGRSIVNAVLTGPGYTDDVRYAFDGEGCDGHDFFVTRHDGYSQSRSSCGWSSSHHWSYASSTTSGLAHGIVCERL